jgi:hypothetical protein
MAARSGFWDTGYRSRAGTVDPASPAMQASGEAEERLGMVIRTALFLRTLMNKMRRRLERGLPARKPFQRAR